MRKPIAWLCSRVRFVDLTFTYMYTINSPHTKAHGFVHIHDSSIWLCPHTFTEYTLYIKKRMAVFTYMICQYDFVHIHWYITLSTYKSACLCSHTWFLDMTLFTYMNSLYMNSRVSLHRKKKVNVSFTTLPHHNTVWMTGKKSAHGFVHKHE